MEDAWVGESQTKENEGDEINRLLFSCIYQCEGGEIDGMWSYFTFHKRTQFWFRVEFSIRNQFCDERKRMINTEAGKVDRDRPIIKLALTFWSRPTQWLTAAKTAELQSQSASKSDTLTDNT